MTIGSVAPNSNNSYVDYTVDKNQALAGTNQAEEASKAKEVEGKKDVAQLPPSDAANKLRSGGAPVLPEPKADFNLALACGGFSDIMSILNEVMDSLAKLKRDGNMASYEKAIASANSLRNDAQKMESSADKQMALAIASAVISGVLQMTQSAIQIKSASNGIKSGALEEDLKLAEVNKDLDKVNLIKKDLQALKVAGNRLSATESMLGAAGDPATKLLDFFTSREEKKTNMEMKQSEAMRTELDAQAKAIQDAADSAMEAFRQAIEVIKEASRVQNQSLINIVG